MANGHRVEALLPPLFETQAEDDNVDREEEDDGGDGEGTIYVLITFVQAHRSRWHRGI